MRIPALNPQPMWRGRPRPRNAKSKIALEGNCIVCLLLLAALTITPCSAQRAVSAGHSAPTHSAAPHFNSPRRAVAFTRNAHRSGFRRSSPYPYGFHLWLSAIPILRRFLRSRRHLFHRISRRLSAASVFAASPEPNDRTRRQQHRISDEFSERQRVFIIATAHDRTPERTLRSRHQHHREWRPAPA